MKRLHIAKQQAASRDRSIQLPQNQWSLSRILPEGGLTKTVPPAAPKAAAPSSLVFSVILDTTDSVSDAA